MARKDITMTDEEVEAFLAPPRNILVATIGRDGWPHLAPLWYVIHAGRVVFRSFTKSQKIVNLQRSPQITVLVEEGIDYSELRGVMMKGKAELNDDPAFVLQVYGELAARYTMVGEGPTRLTDDELEAAFGRFAPENTAVTVHPERIVSWDHTKLGGAY